ncbi:HalOD1 output domain-containing protein [Natronorubrum sp. DTA28]|uniref:HalOD1 output domain-containing protein n=1 Tax=Natronorubrum sp. DTA28 TaxID=3447019 RepID=UPI003F82D6B1
MTEEMLSFAPESTDSTASLSIVERIAALEETDPVTLPPLYDAIDPEALNSLVDASTARNSRSPATVRFTYCGYDVAVRRDGEITIAAA